MANKSTIKQIFMNAITGWGAILIQVLIALVMVPFLIRTLGVDGYGLVGLLMVVVSFSEIADLGLRVALARELSEKVARHDKHGFRVLSSTALVLYLGIALFLAMIGWVLAPTLVSFFKVGATHRDTAVLLLRVYGSCSVLLSFITPAFTSGLASFTRYDLVNLSRAGSQIIVAILLFLTLSFLDFPSLYVWSGVMLTGAVANLFLLYIYYRKTCFSGKIGLRYLNSSELRPLFSLGWKIYILQLTNALSQRVDPLIISRYFSTAGVALYQPGQKVVKSLLPLVSVLSTQLTPFTTRYHVNSQDGKQKRILCLSTRYTMLLGVLFFGAVMIFAEEFSYLWLMGSLGEDYLIVARIMQLSSVVCLLDATGSIHFSILMAQKKVNFAVALNVPFALFNIVLSVFLVGYTKLGVIGVFVGSIISSVIRRPIYIWYVGKITNATGFGYFRAGYLPALFFLVAVLLPGAYFVETVGLRSWWNLVLAGVTYGLYAGVILLFVEWRLVAKIIRKVVRR